MKDELSILRECYLILMSRKTSQEDNVILKKKIYFLFAYFFSFYLTKLCDQMDSATQSINCLNKRVF